jgi:hypothetical protein
MADKAIFALIKANAAIAIKATNEAVAKAKADVAKWEVSVHVGNVVCELTWPCSTRCICNVRCWRFLLWSWRWRKSSWGGRVVLSRLRT